MYCKAVNVNNPDLNTSRLKISVFCIQTRPREQKQYGRKNPLKQITLFTERFDFTFHQTHLHYAASGQGSSLARRSACSHKIDYKLAQGWCFEGNVPSFVSQYELVTCCSEHYISCLLNSTTCFHGIGPTQLVLAQSFLCKKSTRKKIIYLVS